MGQINWKSQEEIHAEQNAPKPLSPDQQTQKNLADLTFQLMIKGVI